MPWLLAARQSSSSSLLAALFGGLPWYCRCQRHIADCALIYVTASEPIMSDQGSISSHDGSRGLPRPRFFGLRISEKEEPSSGRMRGRVLSFSFLVVMASRPTQKEIATYYGVSERQGGKYITRGSELELWSEEEVSRWFALGKRRRRRNASTCNARHFLEGRRAKRRRSTKR